MKTYKCTSKIRAGIPCEYNCIVKAEFEPRGCVYGAMHEVWEELKEKSKDEIKCEHSSTIYDDFAMMVKCGECGMYLMQYVNKK